MLTGVFNPKFFKLVQRNSKNELVCALEEPKNNSRAALAFLTARNKIDIVHLIIRFGLGSSTPRGIWN